MRLLEATLLNACQHRKLNLKFKTGVTGIFGPNGSGKSNLINLIKASLTGDFGCLPGPKKLQINYNSKRGEDSLVRTKWLHNDTTLTIERNLKGGQLLVVEHAGSAVTDQYTSDEDIQDKLSNILGISTTLINNYVFVDQWKIFDFLDQTAAARAKAFAHICGTDKAEDIWQVLGEYIARDSALVATVVDNSAELQVTLSDLSKRLQKHQEELAETEVSGDEDQATEARATVTRWQKRVLLLETKKNAADELDKLDMLKEHAERALRKRAGDATVANVEAAKHKEAAEEASELLKQYEYKATQASRKRLLEQRLTLKAPTAPVEPEKARKSVAEYQNEYTGLLWRLDELRKAINGLQGVKALCPVCRRRIAEPDKLIEQFKQEEQDILLKTNTLHKRKTLRLKYENELREYEGELSRFETVQAAYREELATLGDVTDPTEDTTELQEIVDNYAALVSKADQCDSDYNDYKSGKHARAVIAWQQKKVSLEATVNSIKALKVTKDDYEAATKFLAEFDGRKARRSYLEETIRLTTATIEQTQRQLKAIADAKRRSKNAEEWISDLTTWRDVLHRDKWPKLVAESMLSELSYDINRNLSDLAAPFSIEPNPKDLSFTVLKGGHKESSDKLSGGQKVILAIAYRLAVKALFANHIGLMVMDEPSAGVDSQRLDSLADVLTSLCVATKKKGQQIIMITHDERLERVFDNTIRLKSQDI